MIEIGPGLSIPDAEVVWKATRSGGPGGQNVNKVATRIELLLELDTCSLPDPIKRKLRSRLASRLDSDGKLRIVASRGRSQSENRREALERLREIVANALKPRTKRIATRPTRGSVERRLKAKRSRGDVKRDRRNPEKD